MALTAAVVVNSALELIAAQTQITSLTDGSSAANMASVIYAPTVQLMLSTPALIWTRRAFTFNASSRRC